MNLADSFRRTWNTIDCTLRPLNLAATLRSGQAFRWRADASGIWWGAVEGTLFALWQAEGDPAAPLYWQTFSGSGSAAEVIDYLRLNVPLDRLYNDWIGAEPRIEETVRQFRGLRILRQPPVECFFGFQCATCNTVVKIERSVYRLAERYGSVIPVPPAEEMCAPALPSPAGPPPLVPPTDISLPSAFPTLEMLAAADEQILRGDLWGYRAPRVISLARHLLELGPGWLISLREGTYQEAKAALAALYGIGEKVADCICLFSLDKDRAVPVDTHIRQIAYTLFLPEYREKSLTPRIYFAIAEAYRERFGDYAGWAQQYLFLGAMTRSTKKALP